MTRRRLSATGIVEVLYTGATLDRRGTSRLREHANDASLRSIAVFRHDERAQRGPFGVWSIGVASKITECPEYLHTVSYNRQYSTLLFVCVHRAITHVSSAASDQRLGACNADFTFHRYYNEPAHYNSLKSLYQHAALTASRPGVGLTIALTRCQYNAASWAD